MGSRLMTADSRVGGNLRIISELLYSGASEQQPSMGAGTWPDGPFRR